MSKALNKDEQKSWDGWVAFTRSVTYAIVGTVVVLGLMALALL